MFQYSTDGATWTSIAAEPFSSDAGEWAVRWDTTLVPSGSVFIQAVFLTTAGQTIVSPVVQAQLDQPPVPAVNANAQSTGTVVFDGSQSKDPDGSIVQWIWDFGDGSGGSGQMISHTYASLGTPYSGSLTVVDNSGNSATAYFAVNFLLSPEVKPEDKCVCKAITLRGQTLPQNALGPKGDGSKTWPVAKGKVDGKTLGPYSTNPENKNSYVGYVFEIAVDIDGNPDKCGEIQVVKRTVVATGLKAATCASKGDTWDGTKSLCTRAKAWSGTNKDLNLDGTDDIVVTDKTKCAAAGGTWDAGNMRCDLTFPQSGTKFGPDESIQGEKGGAYESPWAYKVHVPKQIVWFDAPQVGGGDNGTIGNWDFISLIRGTDAKYCYVAYSISAEKKAAGAAETIKQTDTGVSKDSVPGVP